MASEEQPSQAILLPAADTVVRCPFMMENAFECGIYKSNTLLRRSHAGGGTTAGAADVTTSSDAQQQGTARHGLEVLKVVLSPQGTSLAKIFCASSSPYLANFIRP